MSKAFILLSIAIFFLLRSNGQTGKIIGIVKDASSKAIHSATVSLYKIKDSSLVKLVATNKNGEYEFLNITSGKYYVTASNLGYNNTSSAGFEISSANSTINIP